MARLFFLFTALPLLEIALLVQVGSFIGALNTIAIVALTGALGAWMARSQGLSVLRRIVESLRRGEVPGKELLDGAFILIGGALLLTPGLITDVLGLLCLLPPTRQVLRAWALRKIRDRIERGTITVRTL
jgi:UPF0716 protein FxsA